MYNLFLKSDQTLMALESLRKGEDLAAINLSGLSSDDRTYLAAEYCVRSALYSQLESRIEAGTQIWVQKLVYCYRDLFINPQRALDLLDDLEQNCPDYLDLPLRLKFWRAHLNLILGNIEIGKRVLVQIASTIPNGIWKNEMLTIRALGYYFTGRTSDSLIAHLECQKSLDQSPDRFIQTFDCGMATRAALKLCDAANFEYFSQRLDESLLKQDDSRYRLRHTGYRAMIFNQLGEHSAAELHWKTGDEQLHSTESALERGQYLIFRGMSYALLNDFSNAKRSFDLSMHELKLAGSPALYLAELDIAQNLTPFANPATRSMSLRNAVEAAQVANIHFSERSKKHVYPIQAMYSEAAEFCKAILDGNSLAATSDGRQSLVLSVIENVSSSAQFAKGLSHFRLIPEFVHKVTESDLTEEGLQHAMESVLKIKPLLVDGQFHFPGALARLESESEVKTILDFGSSLYFLGLKAKELFQTQSRLKEANRVKHLLHDVRFFSQELSKLAKSKDPKVNLVRLSADLNHLIESYLQAMKNGEHPSCSTIVHFPRLLKKVAKTTLQITGKMPEIPENQPLPFLWISEFLLKRLLLNLIKNGIEAGKGSKPVSISYKLENLTGVERLVIYVSDNGEGLDPEVISSLISNSDSHLVSTKNTGIGLGLRSAIECAKDVGAEISIVPTTRTTGTTFKVSLPLPRLSQKSENPEILVIDDSEAVRSAWHSFGVQEQIKISAVYGEEAVSTLNNLSKGTAWIVTDYDLKLPNCTGADLAPALMGLGAKVALSSGFLKSELPSDALQIPWNAILTKDPQYPVESPQEKVPTKTDEKALFLAINESASKIRHEIKNELTPLRIAIKALTTNLPNDPHVRLLSCSVKGLENIVKQKETSA